MFIAAHVKGALSLLGLIAKNAIDVLLPIIRAIFLWNSPSIKNPTR